MADKEATHKVHVPLDERQYEKLRAESDRTGRPATQIAREAIDRYLEELRRTAVHEAIASYAASTAGTEADLDPGLEAAATEHFLDDAATGRKRGRKVRG